MRPLLCFVVLAGAACGPNLKALEIRQGNEAIGRGDYVVAAEHFKRACELDPKDEKVCGQARSTASTAVRDAIAAAQQRIAQGRYQEAIAGLVTARSVDRDGKVGPVLDVVGDKVATQCETHPLENLADGVRLVRCLEMNRVAIDRAAYSERTQKGRARASALAAQLGEKSAQQGHVGSAYALYGVAQCLSSNAGTDAGKNEHYARFYQRTAVPLNVTARFPWSTPGLSQTDVCPPLRGTRPILACDGPPNARALALDLQVTVGAVAHDVNVERREIEYVDHVETYENPDWQPLQDQAARQRRLVQSLRGQERRDAADCETANAAWQREQRCNTCRTHTWRDSTCNRAEASRQNLNTQIDESNRLDRDASNVPRYLQREIRDVFRYRESTHHYAQAYELLATALGDGRNQPYARKGAVEFTRVEHVGFAKAGLDSSPLVVPQPQQYRAEIVTRARAFVETAVQTELEARAKAKLAGCTNPRDPAQLDCWLEGQFLQTADPLVPYTAVIAEDVGAAYPPAGCR